MTGSVPVYFLHGLAISSEIPLDEGEVSPGMVDLRVGYREGPTREEGQVLIADFVAYGRSWYQAYQQDDSYLLRIPDLADFVVSGDLATVDTVPVDGTDEEALSLLLAGTTLSFVLELRGYCLLHAGAVEIGGSAVAFAGVAGRGKSTCTAMLCALGAPLVTDDLLRVELGDEPIVYRGGSSMRLRERAASLVDLFEVRPPTRRTYDDRLSLTVKRSDPTLPLGAIVLPRPNRSIDRAHLERLTGAEALIGLTEAAKVKGWTLLAHQQRQFEQFGRLAKTVPIFRADLPWSEPMTRGAGEELLAQLESAI